MNAELRLKYQVIADTYGVPGYVMIQGSRYDFMPAHKPEKVPALREHGFGEQARPVVAEPQATP